MSKIGLQIFDEQGKTIVDYTDKILNVYGSFYTSGTNGQVENPKIGSQTKFIIASSDMQTREENSGYEIDSPQISIVGNTIKWQIKTTGRYYIRWLVLYGN